MQQHLFRQSITKIEKWMRRHYVYWHLLGVMHICWIFGMKELLFVYFVCFSPTSPLRLCEWHDTCSLTETLQSLPPTSSFSPLPVHKDGTVRELTSHQSQTLNKKKHRGRPTAHVGWSVCLSISSITQNLVGRFPRPYWRVVWCAKEENYHFGLIHST